MDENLNRPVLTIDPEFQGKIPPLTEAEYKQLEENILTAGEVWEPIVVWNGTIVDGHNRYKIVMEHPEIKWRTREMSFADKWEAFDWMYKNQLGRRNLTDEQRTYLLGKLYEARKHSHGGTGANRYTVLQNAQNDNSVKNDITDQIAREQHVGRATVSRASQFAKGIDAIMQADPDTADAILKGETKATIGTVREAGKADDGKLNEIIESIKEPKKGKAELNRAIKESIAMMTAAPTAPAGYTLDMLLNIIRIGSEQYIKSLENDIDMHKDLISGDGKEAVLDVINNNIISELKRIKEKIKNEI